MDKMQLVPAIAVLTLSLHESQVARADNAPFVFNPLVSEQKQDVVRPFSYFLKQNDQLGFKDSPKGVQLTIDGEFNTQFGKFMLSAGTPLKPLNSRLRTLSQDCLPVINYAELQDDIEYRVQAFATPVNLDPLNNLILFIRVTAHNPGKQVRRAAIGGRFFNREGEFVQDLFDRRQPWWWVDKFMSQTNWTPCKSWEKLDVQTDGQLSRCGHLAFNYVAKSRNWKVIKTEENIEPMEFTMNLQPGQTESVVFKIPFVPVEKTRQQNVQDITNADYDDYLAKTIRFWEQTLNRAAIFTVPEEKVVQMQKASLMYDLVARNIDADQKSFVQTVNNVHYNNFFSRDAAFIIHTYDLMGLHKTAEECIDYVLLRDKDGKLEGFRMTHPDAWGQAVWTMAAHYRMTGDKKFVERIYPAIPPHIEKLKEEIAKDPLGLWPVAGPYDNELINGHYTGHNFWVLLGLQDAVQLAQALGKTEDAATYQALHDDYLAKFKKQLAIVTQSTDGYIPPGLDNPLDGNDWENATGGVYPFRVLSPENPLVAGTVNTIRNFLYQEGITTYGKNAFYLKTLMATNGVDWSQPRKAVIHHYELFNVLQTELALGMDRESIADLYSFLLHSGSTHTGFEYDTWAWRDRFTHNNYAPHGWCAARYNECLRNMLLREDTEKPRLHLASALSPLWLENGKEIRVENTPTDFGPLSYQIKSASSGAEVAIQSNWRQAPEELVFHVPWFLTVTSAKADGKSVAVKDRVIHLPPSTRHLSLAWKWNQHPDLSYESAVKLYLDKYWKLQKGICPPGFDSRWIFPSSEK